MQNLKSLLPRGATLSDQAMAQRHRINTVLLWLHVPVLVVVGLLGPMPKWQALALPGIVATFGALAALAGTANVRADVTSLGLMSGTYVLIQLTGGTQEAHFHLFVVLVFVSLYQRWSALLYAVVSVLIHHAVVGALWPGHVFGMMAMSDRALAGMVAYHAGMVLLEVIGILIVWHFSEVVERDNVRLSEAAIEQTAASERSHRDAAEREAQSERERIRSVAAINAELARQATEIQAGAEEVTTLINAVNDQMAALRESSHEIEGHARQAAEAAEQGSRTAGSAVEEVKELQRSMSEISNVNALISQIAEQTHLLSLNASIEAARAGQHGLGFAVVANEVKTLATETASSTTRVRHVVQGVVTDTEAVATNFGRAAGAVSEINEFQSGIARSIQEQSEVLTEACERLDRAGRSAQEILIRIAGLTEFARTADQR